MVQAMKELKVAKKEAVERKQAQKKTAPYPKNTEMMKKKVSRPVKYTETEDAYDSEDESEDDSEEEQLKAPSKVFATLVATSNGSATSTLTATSNSGSGSEAGRGGNFSTLEKTSTPNSQGSISSSGGYNNNGNFATLAATSAQPLPPHAAHNAVFSPAAPMMPSSSGSALSMTPGGGDHLIISSTEITFEKRLGGGSFGEVFLGRYCGSKVAVKRLLLERLDEEHKREFLAEAQVRAEEREEEGRRRVESNDTDEERKEGEGRRRELL